MLFFVCIFLVLPFLAVSLPPGFSHTPIGPIPTKCITQVPDKAHIYENPQGHLEFFDTELQKTRKVVPCDLTPYLQSSFQHPEDYDGWLAFTSNQTVAVNSSFDAFLGNFSVPDAPAKVPEVLYIFTGLQNINWIPVVDPPPQTPFDIIQPVLKYPSDTGNSWSVNCWYVTLDQGVVVSKELPVEIGSSVFGNMTRIGEETWFIGAVNSKGGYVNINVQRPRLLLQPWAYNTLEGYGVDSCSYEPTKPVQFTGLKLLIGSKTFTPEWKAFRSPTPKCNEHAYVNSSSTVTISFK